MISEIYYNSKLSDKQASKISEKIEICSRNITENHSFRKIVSGSVKVKEMEDLQHFFFNGVKAYVKLDTLFKSNEKDKWVIVDWKTSLKPLIEDEEQLLFYTYYVSQVHNIRPENIETRLEYVLPGYSKRCIFSENDFEFVKGKISHDLEIMKSYLLDVDKNIPKAKESFKKQKSREKCSRCNFREACVQLEQEAGETRNIG